MDGIIKLEKYAVIKFFRDTSVLVFVINFILVFVNINFSVLIPPEEQSFQFPISSIVSFIIIPILTIVIIILTIILLRKKEKIQMNKDIKKLETEVL